jgi:hypothetical protein
MMERLRRQRKQEELQTEAAWPAETASAAEQPTSSSVQVISGASVQSLDLAGLPITQAREVLRAILRLEPNAPVLVNGRQVSADYRLSAGDTLEFVHHAGEKG